MAPTVAGSIPVSHPKSWVGRIPIGALLLMAHANEKQQAHQLLDQLDAGQLSVVKTALEWGTRRGATLVLICWERGGPGPRNMDFLFLRQLKNACKNNRFA